MYHWKEVVISGLRRRVTELCALMENYTAHISMKGSFILPSLSQDMSHKKMIRPRVNLPGKGDPITVRSGDGFFSTASKTALPSIQACIQWIPTVLPLGVQRPGSEADHFS
jgi:hypothetical protein